MGRLSQSILSRCKRSFHRHHRTTTSSLISHERLTMYLVRVSARKRFCWRHWGLCNLFILLFRISIIKTWMKKQEYLNEDTVTPVSPLDSSFTGYAGNSLANTPVNSPTSRNGITDIMSLTKYGLILWKSVTVISKWYRLSGTDGTPVMMHQKPIYLNAAFEIKGTDFRRF